LGAWSSPPATTSAVHGWSGSAAAAVRKAGTAGFAAPVVGTGEGERGVVGAGEGERLVDLLDAVDANVDPRAALEGEDGATTIFIGVLFLEEARRVLEKVRGTHKVNGEFQELKEANDTAHAVTGMFWNLLTVERAGAAVARQPPH